MNSWSNISTFKDIYNIVTECDLEQFEELLCLKTNGKDILETVLRLFAYTDCIKECKDFKVCSGNFNLATVKIEKCRKDLFYEFRNNKTSLKKIKDSGDSSDLTLLNKTENTLLAFTSKNLASKNMSFDNMDLTKLFYYGNQYNSFYVKYAVCCNDRNVFYQMINNAKSTTLKDIDKTNMKNMIVIDRQSLKDNFSLFKSKYENTDFEDMLNMNMEELSQNSEVIKFRPHQEYTINKTLHLIKEYGSNKKFLNILWGHVARSGKSYMAFGLIQKIFQLCAEKNLNRNICIITTAPNETIKQYLEIIQKLRINLKDTITSLDCDSLNSEKNESNSGKLFIFSKQLLTHKDNKEKVKKLFKDYKIFLLMADETHHGGATELSKELLKTSFSKCHKIFITATYNKVKYNFDIHETIKWSLEDIQIMKSSTLNNVYTDADKFVSKDNMFSEDYKIYPNLSIIGVDNIFTDADEQLLTLFKKEGNGFKNKDIIFEVLKYVLGNVIRNVDLINKKIKQRSVAYSTKSTTPVIIIFLPFDNISMTSNMIETLIHRINQSFEVCKCNTIDSNNSFKKI